MGTNYHNEALRKARLIARKQESFDAMSDDYCKNAPMAASNAEQAKIVFSGPGDYEQTRENLEKFRVSDEGFNNRYRRRQHLNPHCDLAYTVVYPGKDNSDYTTDENRNFRRMNIQVDKYSAACRNDGTFITQEQTETTETFSRYTQKNEQRNIAQTSLGFHTDSPRLSVPKTPRDNIYRILHPHQHYLVGIERDRLQYDHSRTGPVNDRTRHRLKQDFNFYGKSLRSAYSDITPARSSMPTCRRF